MKLPISTDVSTWYALACPVAGLELDAKTLQLLDRDGDGFIRTPDVLEALQFVRDHGIKDGQLFQPPESDDVVRLKGPLNPEEEKLLRYKLYLGEFLENFITMDRFAAPDKFAMFQAGTLRIGGSTMTLTFPVANEEAHSALSGQSNCCVLYLKLTRKGVETENEICAVVTHGSLAPFYVGRNGVFFDRAGQDWAAVVTKVVENPVSLVEAFWEPWKKLGQGVADGVKKFLGDRQAKATGVVQKGATSADAGGAAMASSIAAVGIGIGMVGAGAAAILEAIKAMPPVQIVIALVAIILLVSIPSVILTAFKLRKRDLGGILNAGGWAINKKMGLSVIRRD